MNKTEKILVIVLCFLFLVFGVSIAFLLQPTELSEGVNVTNNSSFSDKNISTDTSNDSNDNTSGTGWHEVKSYQKPNSGLKSFNIKGSRFKIIFGGTNTIITDSYNAAYGANKVKITVFMEGSILTKQMVEWDHDEETSEKSQTVLFTTGPGPYEIDISAPQVKNWYVKIYDYY